MNSTLTNPFVFKIKLRKLRNLPKDSEERIKFIEYLLIGTKKCLLENADEAVEKLLSSRYICPFLFRLHEEENIVKISDAIVMALIQPGVLQNFRFTVSIAQSTQQSLIDMCNKVFSPYLATTFRRFKGDLSISFLAN